MGLYEDCKSVTVGMDRWTALIVGECLLSWLWSGGCRRGGDGDGGNVSCGGVGGGMVSCAW